MTDNEQEQKTGKTSVRANPPNPALHSYSLRRGFISDIPQQGHIGECLKILHAAYLQG